jgi:hypothetical protein
MTHFALGVFVVSFLCVVSAQDCKPVTTQTPFNVTEYTRAQWFIQQQMPISYLVTFSPDRFFERNVFSLLL